MAINPEWKEWVEKHRPGEPFTEAEMAIIYLKKVKGVTLQNKKPKINKATGKVDSPPVLPCPSCGGDMTYFRLCLGCELAQTTGNKGMWVCPNSVGARQEMNKMNEGPPGARTYATLFKVYKGLVVPANPTCPQPGIPTTEDYHG